MTHGLSRRDFVKQAAAFSALAALGAVPLHSLAARAEEDDLVWKKAPCRFCGTGCGVIVGVRDGRVVAVQGDLQNPVNKGLLCVKGYNAGVALYGADRLTRPQIRKDGAFVDASWEEAIDLIAKKIMEDSSRFAIYGSGQWTIPEGYAALKFVKGGLGSNEIDPNARLCMASAVVGFLKTFGVDEPAGCYDDFDACDTVVSWGANWAEMHPILFSRYMDRKGRGESVTLIDLATRRTRTSDAADHYLEFKPQSDMAIANCIAYQLLAANKYDRAFVEKHLRLQGDDEKEITLEAFKRFLADYTPEKVAPLSGLSVADLKMLGNLFASRERKVVSIWCMGVNQHTRGSAMNNLIYNVHLLAGKFASPGNTAFSLTGQSSACGTCREVGTLAHGLPGGRVVTNDEHRKETEEIWNVKPGTIPATPGHHAVAMFDALAAGALTGIWIQVTNPAQTIPNLHKSVDKLGERFVVVSDVYPTVTTALADVVLPSAMWVEKNGMFGNAERRTQQWFKMIEPPGDARDDVWQTLAVAHRLFELGFEGMKDKDGNFLFAIRDADGKELAAWNWDVYRTINVDRTLFEEYRRFTTLKRKNLAPYDEYAKARGLRWPVVEDESGVWRETPRRFVEGSDPFVAAGRGVQFYKAPGDRANVIARPYTPPPEIPDAQYPFWLCTGRVLEHWHTGTMTRRVPTLKRAMPAAYVEIHPDDARRLSIAEGNQVRISSRRGSMTARASINGRAVPQKGLVFVPFFDEERLINRVTLDAFCPLSKQPDYKKCAVKVEKIV
jgi:nitrate reductase (cytochrome)